MFRRVVHNADTNQVLFDTNVRGKGKCELRQPIPSEVWHTRTELHFCPEPCVSTTTKLTAHQTRQLQAQIKQCAAVQNLNSSVGAKYRVAEIFSLSRFAPIVEEQGYRAWSVDLKTGYDLSKFSVCREVEAELKQNPPALLVLRPPCTDEGGWLHLNSLYMDCWEYLRRRARSRAFIRFCCTLGSRLWSYPEVQNLARKYPVLKCHMCCCGFQLPGSNQLIRKGTKLMVSMPRCDCR